jgi:hypothetical protein
MHLLAPARTILLFAVAAGVAAAPLTLAGCASPPDLPRAVVVESGQPTTLALHQRRSDLRITLRNDSSRPPVEVYSSAQSDPREKVVPDAELQALLDVYTACGLFEHSLADAPADARDVIVLDQPGRRWAWIRRGHGAPGHGAPGDAAFDVAQQYFLAIYNGNSAYHGGSGDTNFNAEAARLREAGAEAVRRLEQKRSRR